MQDLFKIIHTLFPPLTCHCLLRADLAAHIPLHSRKCSSIPASYDGIHFISKIPAWKAEPAFCSRTATVLQHSDKAWVAGSQRIYTKTKENPGSLKNHPEHIKSSRIYGKPMAVSRNSCN